MIDKKFQLDIFGLMSRIDTGERDIWGTLTEDEQKGFSALIVMKWMSGCQDFRQIIYLNEFVNYVVFQFGKHPELLLSLLGVSSSKTPKRYSWVASKNGKKNKNDKKLKVLCDYYEYSTREAKAVLHLISDSEILEYAEALGYQKDEIALLKKEFI